MAEAFCGFKKNLPELVFGCKLMTVKHIATIILDKMVKKLKNCTIVWGIGITLFCIIKYNCNSTANHASIAPAATNNLKDFVSCGCMR